jgi:hypothetical protein
MHAWGGNGTLPLGPLGLTGRKPLLKVCMTRS